MLVQDSDGFEDLNTQNWQLVAGAGVESDQMRDLEFAWIACRSVKSNAILLAKNRAGPLGLAWVRSTGWIPCRLAVARAGDRVVGSVAASDAFFPIRRRPSGADRCRGNRQLSKPGAEAFETRK